MYADNDNNGLRFLSVCSGIEAASVAFGPLGWRAVAFSEIEKFPSAVLAHHYPEVPNLGDFTKIESSKLGRVDILCGGCPCQSFSIAGLRGSLDDDRGNLTLSFVRLAHELAAGNGLRNAIYENVVGILSTKDNAFGCFLAGLVGWDSAIDPPSRGKWPTHGMVAGPKGRAAWCVKNAEYFGVAQRRRRVLVVADFGNGADPAAVLFEPESLPRNPPARRETGERVAPTISVRTKGGGGLGTDFDLDGGLIHAPEIARCVATREGSSQDYESTTMVAVGVHGDVAHTLKAEGADASEDGTGRGTPVVVQAYSIMPMNSGRDYKARVTDLAQPVMAGGPVGGNQGGDYVLQAAHTVAIRGREGGATAELGGDIATALRASQGGGDKPHVLTSAVRRLTPMECERLQGFPDGYTAIPWRGKPASECPDGPRYKALGNSWAVPKFAWLGKRIAMLMPPVAEQPAAREDRIAA